MLCYLGPPVSVQFRCRHVARLGRCVLTPTKGLCSILNCIAPGMDLSAQKCLRHTRFTMEPRQSLQVTGFGKKLSWMIPEAVLV